MMNYKIGVMTGTMQKCIYLLILFNVLNSENMQAFGMSVEETAVGKEGVDATQNKGNLGAESQEEQSIINDAATSSQGASGSTTEQASEASPAVQSFAKTTAETIASTFISALNGLDSVTGLPSLCNTYIGKPLMNTWLQARKLQLNDNNQVARNSDGSLSFNLQDSINQENGVTPTLEERGLLNGKIDNIVNSVVEMYKQGVSSSQIGKFISNSVELILVTPVVGAGAGAGLMIGTAAGGVGGAVIGGIGAVGSAGDMAFFAPPVAVGVVMGGTVVGGVGGAVMGGYHGVTRGADYTSKFLQSPRKAMSSAINGPSQQSAVPAA